MASYTRFFSTRDGVRIAYATLGQGPPIISIPPFLSHLELMWEAPAFRAFNETLAADFTVIRYDRYGCGLFICWDMSRRISPPPANQLNEGRSFGSYLRVT